MNSVGVCALLTALTVATAHGSEQLPGAAVAQFRGCESAQVCRFWIESLAPERALLRVRPIGIDADGAVARDRLNALLSNMIHQHKRIELRELHRLGDDLFAALIIVNGSDVAADPVLRALSGERAQRAQ
jgi:hypothetical protein